MFNSAKYIGGFSTLARVSGHLVDKPMQIVDKHEKLPRFSSRFPGIDRFYCLLVVDLRSCTNHMMRDAKGRTAIQIGEVPITAHCPKLTAMATMIKLMTAIAKNERSHCSPLRKRLMIKGVRHATVANSQATASGD